MNGKRITISLALTLAAAFIYYVVSIETTIAIALPVACLLYTSDAADEL